jgi:hypothetical protein
LASPTSMTHPSPTTCRTSGAGTLGEQLQPAQQVHSSSSWSCAPFAWVAVSEHLGSVCCSTCLVVKQKNLGPASKAMPEQLGSSG